MELWTSIHTYFLIFFVTVITKLWNTNFNFSVFLL